MTVAVGVLMTAGQEAVALVDHMNTWVELVIKVGGAAAAIGAAWRWLVGPGFRGGRSAVHWVRSRLELLERMDERLGRMEDRLDEGERHFRGIDTTLEVMATEEARAVRRAIRSSGEVQVQVTPQGGVERREPPM